MKRQLLQEELNSFVEIDTKIPLSFNTFSAFNITSSPSTQSNTI